MAVPAPRQHASPQVEVSPRRRTAAVVIAGICAFLGLFAPQPLLPMLARVFHVSAAAVSLVVTASTVAVALAAPLAGMLSDRLGRRRVIVPAAFLLAVPTLLAATATTLGQLLFWRFLQGLLTPGIFAVTIAYVNEEWESGAGAAVAAYVTGTVIGGFSGRFLGAIVAAHWSWPWTFVLLGALNLLGAVAIWRWLPAGRRFARPEGSAFRLRPCSGTCATRNCWRRMRWPSAYCSACWPPSPTSTFTWRRHPFTWGRRRWACCLPCIWWAR